MKKTVLLGITGGIACYKAAGLASGLVKAQLDVQVVMTKNATEFVAPL
ncbi:MAG: flavoprotein, partial [Oscillospiraceae bacterium]